jgi:integrase
VKRKTKKLPVGVFWVKDVLWIRYRVDGKLYRESTGQTSVKVAEQIRNKRKTEVAVCKHFPSRKFEKATFGELLDYWWNTYAKFKPSKFEYLLPRLDRFRKKKARQITSDIVRDFLVELFTTEELSASSVNHYRTIMNSVFNHAIKNKRYDENPVRAVPMLTQPPGRDRFTSPDEIQKLMEVCEKEDDLELRAFIAIAATTGLRKGSILPLKFSNVFLDSEVPYVYVGRTKNGDPIKIPLAETVVETIKTLPSYGKADYLFPAKPNVRFQSNFKKPHAWDMGKRFRRICKLAGIQNLRIHDLRHFVATVLFMKGVPDAMIAKVTGHRSRELKRYQHLSPEFRKQTVEMIAGELSITNRITQLSSDLVQ